MPQFPDSPAMSPLPNYEDVTPRQITQIAGCDIVQGAAVLVHALSKKYPQHAMVIGKKGAHSKWLYVTFIIGYVLALFISGSTK